MWMLVLLAGGIGLALLSARKSPSFPEIHTDVIVRDASTGGRTGYTGQTAWWTPERAAVETYGPRVPDRWNATMGVFEYDGPTGLGSYTPTVKPTIKGRARETPEIVER